MVAVNSKRAPTAFEARLYKVRRRKGANTSSASIVLCLLLLTGVQADPEGQGQHLRRAGQAFEQQRESGGPGERRIGHATSILQHATNSNKSSFHAGRACEGTRLHRPCLVIASSCQISSSGGSAAHAVLRRRRSAAKSRFWNPRALFFKGAR